MNENNLQVIIINRDTYDVRYANNQINNNTLYFVREPTPYYDKCMSIYLGKLKISELININDLLELDNIETIINGVELQDFLNSSQYKIPNKLYIYENTELGLAQTFVYSTKLSKFIPCQSGVDWIDLD